VRACKENYLEINDTELCWFEWGEKDPAEETIFLIHATGFHARCWDQTIKYLGDEHIIAIDLRGHGRSKNKGPFGWDQFGADVTALVNSLDLNEVVGVGHSMGGHALSQTMAHEPGRFKRAVLVDPVIMDPEFYVQAGSPHENFIIEGGGHPVARRRNQFADAQAMFDNFEGRGSYSTWLKESLQDYCEYGLVPDPQGLGFNLACPPEVEAAIYMGNSSVDIHELVEKITIPVTVLRAQQRESESTELDFSKSPTWTGLADLFGNGRDVYLPQLTHFMPNQNPQLVAEFILGKR